MATVSRSRGIHSRAREALLASNWWAAAIRGVCAILIGAFAILSPAVTLVALTMIFAAYCFVDGIFAIVLAIRGARRHERWGWLALNGIVSLAAAAAAVLYPAFTIIAFAILFGVWALISGTTSLAAAVTLSETHGRWWLLASGIIAILVGIWALWDINVGMLALSYLVGFQAFAAGFMLLGLAWRLRERYANPAGRREDDIADVESSAAPAERTRAREAQHG
jgi:uncharacterized membrane protein HdeD (DUF308 family)